MDGRRAQRRRHARHLGRRRTRSRRALPRDEPLIAADLARIPLATAASWLGSDEIEPPVPVDAKDRRFAAPAWQQDPWFRAIRDAYLLAGDQLRGPPLQPGRLGMRVNVAPQSDQVPLVPRRRRGARGRRAGRNETGPDRAGRSRRQTSQHRTPADDSVVFPHGSSLPDAGRGVCSAASPLRGRGNSTVRGCPAWISH